MILHYCSHYKYVMPILLCNSCVQLTYNIVVLYTVRCTVHCTVSTGNHGEPWTCTMVDLWTVQYHGPLFGVVTYVCSL